MTGLKHDSAFVATGEILNLFLSILRSDEVGDAHAEVYRILRAMLDAYEAQTNRMNTRLRPSRN